MPPDNAHAREAAPAPARWSLQREFARLLLLASILPALLFGGVEAWSQYHSEGTQLRQRLSLSARLASSSIDDFLEGHRSGVALLADGYDAVSVGRKAGLERLIQRYPAFITVLATDREGHVRGVALAARQRAGPVGSVVDRDYFRVPARTGLPYVSNAFRGRVLGQDPLVAVSAPILRNGAFDGVVEGSLRVDTFTRLRGESLVARGYEMLLVDRAGKVIHATAGLPYAFLDQVDTPRFGPPPSGPTQDVPSVLRRENMMRDGSPAYVASRAMRSGWTLYLLAPQSQLTDALVKRGLLLSGLLLLIMIGVVAASWRQMRLLAKSTQRLLQALQEVALGRSREQGEARGMPVELLPVATAVSDLADRLNQTYGELKDALDSQRSLAESLRGVIAERDQEIAARTADLRQAVAELEHLARTDPLTGALNVRALRERVDAPFPLPDVQRVWMGVLAIDVDHFKAYNDRYGHPAGDVALKRVVGAIRGALRGVNDEVARVGGEEFVVLMSGTDESAAKVTAQRIIEAVYATDIAHADSAAGRVTVSIGVAVATAQGGVDMEAALKRADEALYRAKREGRNRVCA